MIKNCIKITFRNLVRNRVSTVINLLGLSLGISVCLLIFLLIDYELNFDNFHSKNDRIYRVVREESTNGSLKYSSSTPFPMKEALVNDYPELDAVTQVFEPQEYQIKVGEDIWMERNVLFADSSFFKIFDFPAIIGNPVESFRNTNVAFITESMAKARFGDQSPVGLTVNVSEAVDVEIVGILKDPPKNSHIPFSMIIVLESFNDTFVGGFKYDNWNVTIGFKSYVLLPEEESKNSFEEKFAGVSKKYLSERSATETNYSLQPLNEIHFDKKYAESNFGYTVDTTYLWVLGVVGVVILLLACINFINLST
ncbi:MAG: ABC transporter permease, partial [Cyclobacteriaceae bacterium]